MIINLNCAERYEFKIDHHLNGIWTHDLFDTGAVLYQLSYQAKPSQGAGHIVSSSYTFGIFELIFLLKKLLYSWHVGLCFPLMVGWTGDVCISNQSDWSYIYYEQPIQLSLPIIFVDVSLTCFGVLSHCFTQDYDNRIETIMQYIFWAFSSWWSDLLVVWIYCQITSFSANLPGCFLLLHCKLSWWELKLSIR